MLILNQINRKTFNELDDIIGIYIFKHDEEYLYIGKSINVKARLKSHLENAKVDVKEKLIIENSNKIIIIATKSEFSAIILEANLIKRYLPKYNRIWRDDKSFIYIKISVKDKYPKVTIGRKPTFAEASAGKSKSLYFGPYSSSSITRILIKEIRKVFPFCSQNIISKKPCFYNKIGLCNPCPNYIEQIIDTNIKRKLIKDYKHNIKNIISILDGKSENITKKLRKQMKELTQLENYEDALKIRDLILYFDNLVSHRIHLGYDHVNEINSKEGLNQLNKILSNYFNNINLLNRIECYDISNLFFENATASMVVCTDGVIDKSQYRKFKIKNLKIQSDFEMIEEVVIRRFNNKWKDPDLIVVDGGKPQVRMVMSVLFKINKNINVVGIAKNPDRLIIGNNNLPTLRISLNNFGFNLIRKLRDESHRFAKKYHLLLRDRKFLL